MLTDTPVLSPVGTLHVVLTYVVCVDLACISQPAKNVGMTLPTSVCQSLKTKAHRWLQCQAPSQVTVSLLPVKMALETQAVPLKHSIQGHRNEIRALEIAFV